MYRYSIIIFAFFVAMLCFSCEDEGALISVNDDNIFETDVEKNSPRISKENGSFAYVLKGDNYSGTTNEGVNFEAEKVALTINLDNHKNGTCSIKIMSDYNNELFSKVIGGDIIYSEVVDLDDYPEQIIIVFENFSGTLKFALAEDD